MNKKDIHSIINKMSFDECLSNYNINKYIYNKLYDYCFYENIKNINVDLNTEINYLRKIALKNNKEQIVKLLDMANLYDDEEKVKQIVVIIELMFNEKVCYGKTALKLFNQYNNSFALKYNQKKLEKLKEYEDDSNVSRNSGR